MVNYEEYMQIKILFKQGKSIREISRILKMSRNTVRRYLKQESGPSYKSRPDRKSKLAPFYDYLQGRIKAAHPHWIPGPVLFREIKEMGYPGSLRLLNVYLKSLKKLKEEIFVVFVGLATQKQKRQLFVDEYFQLTVLS